MKRLTLLFGVLLSFSFFTIIYAQTDPIIIPFRPIGKTIVIQGSIDGQIGNLVIDTGISKMILNKSYVKSENIFTNDEFGGIRSVDGAVQNLGMSMVGLKIEAFSIKLAADVMDLKPIEKQKRMNIMGMVGLQIFRKYEFEIDFFSSEIRLHDLDKRGIRKMLEPQALPSQTLTFDYEGHLLCIPAHLDGKTLRLGLDTGAEMNLLAENLFEEKGAQYREVHEKTLLDLNGEQVKAFSAKTNNFQVGTDDLPPIEILFVPLKKHYGGINTKKMNGLFGFEFFQHFRIAINFKKRRIALWDAQANQDLPLAAKNRNN